MKELTPGEDELDVQEGPDADGIKAQQIRGIARLSIEHPELDAPLLQAWKDGLEKEKLEEGE